MPKKITLTELRAMIRDETVPDAEIAAYLKEAPDQGAAFAPQLRIDPALVDDEGREADVLMGWFNAADRRRRQRRYHRRIAGGWTGLRIVSEGDSWFQYPFLLHDVIDHLSADHAIYSLGAAGDLMSDMLAQDEILAAIELTRPHLLLLSGGGNDLLGDGRLARALHRFDPDRAAEDYPNGEFGRSLTQVIAGYRRIITDVQARHPGLRILCHGYDYALPDRGRWLGKPMAALGIKDRALQAAIIRVLIDRFNAALADLAQEYRDTLFYVDARNAVPADQWHDELHPDRDGYRHVADRFRLVIDAVAGRIETAPRAAPRLSPGKEARIADARDLDPRAFRELVAHRGREILGADIPSTVSEARRRAVEADISDHFEKISGGADFLPASFLRDGAARAAAVCRIRLPGSVGSGFLLARRNFIMTNNHVIADRDEAEAAVAEFQFDAGETPITVALTPRRFFVTDAGLDFTICACDGAPLGAITPIPLLRSPTTVTRNERVNIIQHPRGRPKEVALHDNKVRRVKDKVIHYTTDTEPGSSGSPVFNNDWQLVALHHAGWHEPDGSTTNEGVRIASIVSHLVAQRVVESDSPRELFDLLEAIPDTSPLLGFFDVAGIVADPREIEVPEYRGSADFADIGVWNIEHFNDRIAEARVTRVAEVLNRLSLDVMALIEVQRGAMERLTEALRALGQDYDFKYLNVRGAQDLAVLYDRRTSEVTLAQDIMNRHGDAWAATTATGRSAFPRRPLIARVSVDPRAGHGAAEDRAVAFILIAVHLKAFGDPESRARRRLAARILAEVIADIRATENLPVVLGGDLNETLNTDVLDALTETPDLFALTSDDQDDNALSYVGASHRSLIDHIIVSRDVRMSPIHGDDAAIVRLDRSVADYTRDISDHVPLVIRMINRDAPVQVPGAEGPEDMVPVPAGARHLRWGFD